MDVIPFLPEHVAAMRLQARDTKQLSCLPPNYLIALQNLGLAFTAVTDGRVVASAGVAVLGFGVGTVWAFVAADAGRHFIRLDRGMRRLLEIPRLRRIEATAEADFRAGCRWLELLDLKPEGLMHKYGPHGEDHIRYAKVSE